MANFLWGGLPQRPCPYEFAVPPSRSAASIGSLAKDYSELSNPKTVPSLSYSMAATQVFLGSSLAGLWGADVQTADEEYYPHSIGDVTPYLTKIESLDPDLLLLIASNKGYAAMAGLGSLGDTTIVCNSQTEIAQGEGGGALEGYVSMFWTIGSLCPRSERLDENYQDFFGAPPTVGHICYYCSRLLPATKLSDWMAATTARLQPVLLPPETWRSSYFRDLAIWGAPRSGHIAGLYMEVKYKRTVQVPAWASPTDRTLLVGPHELL